MVSSAIEKKHARVSFSKIIKIQSQIHFFQIARETILLLINNIHGIIIYME
jgi:hypothetical protein